MLDHCRLFYQESKIPKFRAFHFSTTQFELWEVVNGGLDNRICGFWTDAGSSQLFSDFFASNHLSIMGQVLHQVCEKLKVSVVPASRELPSFLGAGGLGTVFRVVDQDKTQFALKIATGPRCAQLLEAERAGLSLVSADTALSCRNLVDLSVCDTDVAALLLFPVLEPASKSKLRTDDIYRVQGLNALWRLHDLGIAHRDARVENLLYDPQTTSFLWCDLVAGDTVSKVLDCRDDVTKFIGSFTRQITTELKAAICQYNPHSKDKVFTSATFFW